MLIISPAVVELSNKNCLNLLSILRLTPLVYPASEASEKRRILRVRKLTIYCECRVYAQSLAALIMIRVYELRSLAGGELRLAGMSVTTMQKFPSDVLAILKNLACHKNTKKYIASLYMSSPITQY